MGIEKSNEFNYVAKNAGQIMSKLCETSMAKYFKEFKFENKLYVKKILEHFE